MKVRYLAVLACAFLLLAAGCAEMEMYQPVRAKSPGPAAAAPQAQTQWPAAPDYEEIYFRPTPLSSTGEALGTIKNLQGKLHAGLPNMYPVKGLDLDEYGLRLFTYPNDQETITVIPFKEVQAIFIYHKEVNPEAKWFVIINADSSKGAIGAPDRRSVTQLADSIYTLSAALGREFPPRRLGVGWDNLTPDQAKDFGLAPNQGVLVVLVAQGGPADRAGIQRLDVITKIGDAPVTDAPQASKLVDAVPAGAKVKVRILRGGGQVMDKEI